MKADIPGVSKEDIHVSVDRDMLRINVESKAEKEEEKEEQGRKYHRWAGGGDIEAEIVKSDIEAGFYRAPPMLAGEKSTGPIVIYH